ncbi:MAG: hypothetical protein QG632_107 [Candidatus Dependentiae bacterium]|nr:hypothetical protein [Candidatus Dependentiae bacterium]
MVSIINFKQSVFLSMFLFFSLLSVTGEAAAVQQSHVESEEVALPLLVNNFRQELPVCGSRPEFKRRVGNNKVVVSSYVDYTKGSKCDIYMFFDEWRRPESTASRSGWQCNWRSRGSRPEDKENWCAIRIDDLHTLFVPVEYRKWFATDLCEHDASRLDSPDKEGLLGLRSYKRKASLRHKIEQAGSKMPGDGLRAQERLFFGVCSLVCAVVFDAVFMPYKNGFRNDYLLFPAENNLISKLLFDPKVYSINFAISNDIHPLQCHVMALLVDDWAKHKGLPTKTARAVLRSLDRDHSAQIATHLYAEYADEESYSTELADAAFARSNADDLKRYLAVLFRRAQDGVEGSITSFVPFERSLEPLADIVKKVKGEGPRRRILGTLFQLADEAVKQNWATGSIITWRALAMLSFLSRYDEVVERVGNLLQVVYDRPAAAEEEREKSEVGCLLGSTRGRALEARLKREEAEAQLLSAKTRKEAEEAAQEKERAKSARERGTRRRVQQSGSFDGEAVSLDRPLLSDIHESLDTISFEATSDASSVATPSSIRTSVSGSPHSLPRKVEAVSELSDDESAALLRPAEAV